MYMFFYRLFNKDIVFFRFLSDRNKKLLVYFLIFFFFYIFYIKIERLISFLILLLFLLIWKIFMEFLIYIIVDNNKLKIFIRAYDDKFSYIIKLLLFIQKWKNPFLLLLLYIDKFLFKIIRNLIYNFKIKYNYELTEDQLFKVFFFYYFIINIIFGPFKLFFGFIYTIIYRMIEFPFSFFFIIRIVGFISSVLIFLVLLNILYSKWDFIYLFLFIYFLLIFINCIIKYIDRDFKYLKIQYINKFINTDYLIYLRNNSTFFGILILNISWYKSSLIDKKYIDITSTYLKLDLEEGFYKYWEYYKRNSWLNTTNIWKEIKNRPSFFLYINLITWINISPINIQYAPSAITNIIYIKCKMKHLNISLPEDLLYDLNFLYKFFLLRLKLLLYMVWDIDDYIGNKNFDYIVCAYDKEFKNFNIGCDYNIFDFINWNNFKIEKEKEDLPFYDLEVNMEFFNRLYMLVGIIPYNENPLELTVFSNILIKVKNITENIELRLNYSYNLTSWNRGWHFHISNNEEQEMLLIEKEVKNWIIQFLKKTKQEWNFSLKKEKIKDRNIRLLNEIEDLLLKKKLI